MDAERLRRKALEYELNQRSAEERGDQTSAICFAAVAMTLYELAVEAAGEELQELGEAA